MLSLWAVDPDEGLPHHPSPLGNRDIIRTKQAQRTDEGVIHLNNLLESLHAVLYIVFIMLI